MALAALVVGLAAVVAALQTVPLARLPFALQKMARLVHVFELFRHTPAGHPSSVGIRLALYLSGLHGFLAHPWGMGPRGAMLYYRYQLAHHSPWNTYGVMDPHNMWLEVAMNFGFIGFILYVGFYAGLMVQLFRLTAHADPWVRYLAISCFSALFGFILGSLSPSSVFIGFDIMWVVYGLALGAVVLSREPSQARPPLFTTRQGGM
jgi:O-antigen ligase